MRSLLANRGAGLSSPRWLRWLVQGTFLLLCGWLIGSQPMQAQDNGATLSLDDYQQQIARWQARIEQPDGATTLQTVQQESAAIQQIELPSGALIQLQPLLGDPESDTPDLLTAQARLATLSHELAAASADETAVRLAVLDTIFQRPEFTARDSLWDRFWRWLRSWLPEMQREEGNAGALSPLFAWLGWGLVGVGAVLLIWLLSYWLQQIFGNFVGGVERQPTLAAGDTPETAFAARTAAHQLADAGSYREAVRYLYLSALLTLHERNLITYQPSDTNREVLRAIRHQPVLHQQLQPVIKTFDDVWYGVHEPDRTSFDSYVAAVAKLEEAK